MVRIQEAIVVEGRYDKNTLSQIVDAPILETSGFGIMKDQAQLALLRKVAMKRGLIVFTDSDGAGFVIRNFLKGHIDPKYLKHAYIPDIPGKERRKAAPGKEGKLGVEALRRAGATMDDETFVNPCATITKQDMMELGLSGGKNSREKRLALVKYLDLPEHISTNALLQALNLLTTLVQLRQYMADLEKTND